MVVHGIGDCLSLSLGGFNSHQSFGQWLNVLAKLTNLTNLFSRNLGENPIEFTFGRDKGQRKIIFAFAFTLI